MNLTEPPHSPDSFLYFFLETKKGEMWFFVGVFYGLFLSINKDTRTRPTTMTTNKPAIAGTKYVLATEAGVAVGAAVDDGALHHSKMSFSG